MLIFRIICVAAVLMALASAIHAQDYPSRIIRIMIGFPPGGQIDAVARIVGQELSKSLGQPVVMENKAGVGGGTAAEFVARSAPDGYTLIAVPGVHSVTPYMFKNLNYHPADDFEWISSINFYPYMIVVGANSRFKTLRDLLEAARAKAHAVTVGSPSIGSLQHLSAELLAQSAKVDFLSVPYRGEAPALNGLLSGDVDFVVSTTVAIPQVNDGRLRALAVTGRSRLKELPNVPTVESSVSPNST